MFLSNEPSVGRILKYKGEMVARAVVSFLISDMLENFSVKETMSDTQIAFAADIIIEEYPHLQVDDFKLCFRNAMKLKYGEVYNRVDVQVIMKWLKQYNRERCDTADMQSYNEHKAILSEEQKPTEGMFYSEYRAELERKAALGDTQAKNALNLSNTMQEKLNALKTLKNAESENQVSDQE